MIEWRTSANGREASVEAGDYTSAVHKGARPSAVETAEIEPRYNEKLPHSYLYQLAEDPFRLTPDPRFCLGHPSYLKARGCFEYALLRAEGFVVVTGVPGTGKTMLVHDMLADLAHEPLVVGPLLSSQLDTDELLPMVALSFDINVEGRGKVAILGDIRKFIVAQKQRGCRTIVIVDEAQALSVGALEELRLLSNLRQREEPLVQIFLLGQENLWDRVRHHSLTQLHQRVIAACHLEPLDAEQTGAYVRHRLEAAGWKGDPDFGEEVFPLVHWFSGGIPRRINTLCSRLLLAGYEDEKHALGREEVLGAIVDLKEEGLAAPTDNPPSQRTGIEANNEVANNVTRSLASRALSHEEPVSPQEVMRSQSDATAPELNSPPDYYPRQPDGSEDAEAAAAQAPGDRFGSAGQLLEALDTVQTQVSCLSDTSKLVSSTVAPASFPRPETLGRSTKPAEYCSSAARSKRWDLLLRSWLLPFLVVYSVVVVFLFWWDRQSWVEPQTVAQKNAVPTPRDIEQTGAVFAQRARTAQKEGRLADALAALEEGLKAAPGQVELTRLQAKVRKEQERALSRRREVEKLTALAESQIAASRYGEPADGNAIDTFRRILELDPANTKARQRLRQLAELFEWTAQDKQQVGQLERSLSLIDVGLGAEPHHKELRALREEVSRQLTEERQQQQQ